MKARHFAVAILLCFVTVLSSAQEVSKTSADWSKFDPVALIAAASKPSTPQRFERLWTSKQRMRLFDGLAISADGKRVLAVNLRGEAQIFDADSGKALGKLSESAALATKGALSTDGSVAALGLHDGAVVTFDTATGKTWQRHTRPKDPKNRPTKVLGLQFTRDGQHVAWVDELGGFYRGAVRQADKEGRDLDQEQRALDLRCHSISPDGRILFGPSVERNQLHVFACLPEPNSQLPPRFFLGLEHTADSCAQSENLLAYHNSMGQLAVQKRPQPKKSTITTQAILSSMTPQTSYLRSVAISSDERWIMHVGRGQVELRRTDLYNTPSLHDADFDHAAQVALSPDSLRVAVVDQDGYLTVLGLKQPPSQPAWEFERTIKALAHDEQYDHLEKIGELLQSDSEPFPNHYQPKYDFFLRHVLRLDRGPLADPQARPEAEQIATWLKARPNSSIARLRNVERLIGEGWEARGSGFANTVTEEGWQVFHSKIKESHAQIEPLLKLEHPPPGTFACLFDIAKAEGWSEDQCLEQAERLMQINPTHIASHRTLMQKLLMRWGGGPHSSADYATWAGNKMGGPEGDALYTMLVVSIVSAEENELVRESLGIDFERYRKGCQVLQKSAHWRPVGLLTELQMAVALQDVERSAVLAKTIEREKTPFVPGAIASPSYLEVVFRVYVDRP